MADFGTKHEQDDGHEDPDFDSLVLLYLDDAENDQIAQLLIEKVSESPRLRARFVAVCVQASAVREFVRNRKGNLIDPVSSSGAALRDLQGDPAQVDGLNPRQDRRWRIGRWTYAAAIALLTAALGLGLLIGPWSEGYDWPTGAVAMLEAQTQMPDASRGGEFKPVFFQPGEQCAPVAGEPMKLLMRDGTAIVLAGGSELTFDRSDRVSLRRGKLIARVSGSNTGFTVQTPSCEVVDHGTEFSVRVDPSGAAAVHLFEGAVDIHSYSKGTSLKLKSGQAGVVSHEGALHLVEQGMAEQFLWYLPDSVFAAKAIELGPVFYLPMHGDAKKHDAAALPASARVFEASIRPDRLHEGGGAQAQGSSLILRSVDAPLTVADAFEPITRSGVYSVVLWVRPDRLGSQNIITATGASGPASDFGPQLRVRPDGTIEHVGPSANVVQRSTRRLRAGQWSMIVASMDENGLMRLYLDGVQAANPQVIRQPTGLKLSSLAIGGPAGQQHPIEHHVTGYDGLIDDLFVFDRALTVDEVRLLSQTN